MARERANINTAIWGDRDWRKLTSSAKCLYMLLLTHPTISYAGVVDWRPNKLAPLSPDTTPESLEVLADELQDARFVFVDHESEEVLIRSYLRHDGILKQPKLSVSMANAYSAISSMKVQDIVAFELHRLFAEHPDWSAWKSAKVQEIRKKGGADMSTFTLSAEQDLPIEKAVACPTLTLNAEQAQALPTSTATTTTTSTDVEGSGETRKKPSVKLSASWKPNETHTQYAEDNGIDLEFQAERFRNHAEASDRRMVNWDSAFRNWLLKAERTTKTKPTASSPWNQEFYK